MAFMMSDARFFFWPVSAPDRAAEQPPARRPSPVFIGDAIQPWGSDTLLMSILQREQKDD